MLRQDMTKPGKAKPQPGKATAPNGSTRTAAANQATGPRAAARKSATGSRKQADLQQRIQQRAYELWESEGRPEGRQQAHWMQAQHEIAEGQKARAGAKL